jgi:hypothetical protein
MKTSAEIAITRTARAGIDAEAGAVTPLIDSDLSNEGQIPQIEPDPSDMSSQAWLERKRARILSQSADNLPTDVAVVRKARAELETQLATLNAREQAAYQVILDLQNIIRAQDEGARDINYANEQKRYVESFIAEAPGCAASNIGNRLAPLQTHRDLLKQFSLMPAAQLALAACDKKISELENDQKARRERIITMCREHELDEKEIRQQMREEAAR